MSSIVYVTSTFLLLCLITLLIRSIIVVVPQSHVMVLSIFGKYSRYLVAGLNIKMPWEMRTRLVSLQNVVYKFASKDQFKVALIKLLEGETRTIIANYKQQDVLGIREHLSVEVEKRVADKLANWGYQLLDLQVTNISFDEEIVRSMNLVVAAANKQRSAENEGEALKTKLVKEAEANGQALKIQAEAEKLAWKLKGEGLASFREEIASGIAKSAQELREKGVRNS